MFRFDTRAACTLTPLSLPCLTARCDPRSMLHKSVRILRAFATNKALKGLPFSAIHVSKTGMQTIGRFLPREAEQTVIENPVEVEDVGPCTFTGDRKLTYCGRLTEENGADLVAAAAREANIPSLFIGDGPLREKILQIDPEAEITGWLDKPAVRQRIRDSALAVAAPSRWPETGPLVIAEAMAQGVPVIASSMSGAAARIEHGQTGFVLPPDGSAIANAASSLRDETVAAAMGKRAYEAYWSAPPSLRSHASQLAELYARRLVLAK
ncbi:MAG: glycosyltransferase [Beijerinckiaceae bacterium]